MRKVLVLLITFVVNPAFAQWQVPVNNIPVGLGPGKVGFGVVTPSASGLCLMSNGTSTIPTFQTCPGAGTGGSVTQVTCGTGLSGGTFTISGTCAVNYGTSASTAAQGNDSRIVGALQATPPVLIGTSTAAHVVRFGEGLGVANSAAFGGAGFSTYSTSAGESPLLELNRSKSATIGTHAAVASGDLLGDVVFRGSDGTVFRVSAEVAGLVDGAVSAGIVPGRIQFNTTNSSGAATEAMRITSAQQVGIGTTTPSAPLVVKNPAAGAADTFQIQSGGTTNGDGSILSFINSASSVNAKLFVDSSTAQSTARLKSLGALIFHTGNAATDGTNPQMAISNVGQILIPGSITPTVSVKLTLHDLGGVTAYYGSDFRKTDTLSVGTEGAQNAVINAESTTTGTSGGGTIAQANGIRAYAQQVGSGDAVGFYGIGSHAGTGKYAGFGGFFVGIGIGNSEAGACAMCSSTQNQSGTNRTWNPSGPYYFIGTDQPYSAVTNSGDAAFLLRNTDSGKWDCGFCAAPNTFGTYFVWSTGFRVDKLGNETALSNTATSDERLKQIHGPFKRGLTSLAKIKPIRYHWKTTPEGPELAGVSAQNMLKAIPESVSEDKDGTLGVSDRPLVAALINAVAELNARIKVLERRKGVRK